MNRRTLLITTVLLLLFTKPILADCIACWELKYIRITLNNEKVIEGYFRWNEVWPKVFNKENKELNTFYQEVVVYKNYIGQKNLILYNQIYQIESPLTFFALYTTTDLVDTVNIENIKSIEIINLNEKSIVAAGDITDLEINSKKLLKKTPISFYHDEGICGETFFLSYNDRINEDSLKQISKTRDCWLKRKYYEEQNVILITNSWD